MDTQETLRTFVALPLSESGHERLGALQQKLIRTLPDGHIRWVPPGNIHLTLFFLGDVRVDRIPAIQEALTVVARNVLPFTCEVAGLGAFPNTSRPRVIWVGLEESTGRLELLHTAVNEALTQLGFEPDRRPFHPHLTLGRVRRGRARSVVRRIGEGLAEMQVGAVTAEHVEQMLLFRSDLGPSGAVYTALHTFPLKG